MEVVNEEKVFEDFTDTNRKEETDNEPEEISGRVVCDWV